MKKLYEKNPVLYGILIGQGLLILFLFFEYFLVATGISECGLLVDSCLRIVFGIVALLFMKVFYGKRLSLLFTHKIPKVTWLYCIPFFLYLGIEFLFLPLAESLTTAFVGTFMLACLQQLATGLLEETTAKGLLMSGMLRKWTGTIKGRIGMVFLSGILFGTLHILNFVFSKDIVSCLRNSLYACAFGTFVAAIYLVSQNLLLCMVIHAAWDIIIRIPRYFCENVQGGAMAGFINISQDVLELAIFPLVAVLICVVWKQRDDDILTVEIENEELL